MKKALMVGGVVLATACAGGPGPGDVGYAFNVDGSYVGRLTVEGTPFDAAFDLSTTPDGHVYGTFTVLAPLEVEGEMSGRVLDDLLRMTMSYETTGSRGSRSCPSVVEGILTVSAGGGEVDGPVTITDCGDALAGRLSFRRSEAGF